MASVRFASRAGRGLDTDIFNSAVPLSGPIAFIANHLAVLGPMVLAIIGGSVGLRLKHEKAFDRVRWLAGRATVAVAVIGAASIIVGIRVHYYLFRHLMEHSFDIVDVVQPSKTLRFAMPGFLADATRSRDLIDFYAIVVGALFAYWLALHLITALFKD